MSSHNASAPKVVNSTALLPLLFLWLYLKNHLSNNCRQVSYFPWENVKHVDSYIVHVNSSTWRIKYFAHSEHELKDSPVYLKTYLTQIHSRSSNFVGTIEHLRSFSNPRILLPTAHKPISAETLTIDMTATSYKSKDGPGQKPLSDGRYVQSERRSCVVTENICAPEVLEIKDHSTGKVEYKVKTTPLSFERKKRLFDSDGDKLFSMHSDITSLLSNMFFKDFRTNDRYLVRKKSFFPGMGRGTLQVFVNRKREPVIEIVSNFNRTNITIVSCINNALLGTIDRRALNAKRMLTGLHSYTFDVRPGVDIPLMVMFAVCFNEQYTEGGVWLSCSE